MSKTDMIINPITGEIDLDLHRIVKGFSTGGQSLKDSLKIDAPQRTPNHPSSSHVVKTRVDGKDKMIRFGEQGASTAGKPKEGESDKMKAKRKSFKSRHVKNIDKGKSSAAYWADREKWAEGGGVESLDDLDFKYAERDAYFESKKAERDAYFAKRAEMRRTGERDFTGADVANTVIDFTPIIGDIKGGVEGADLIYEELKKDEPNWLLIGVVGGAAVLGVIPLIGDAAKKLIMKGAKGFKKDRVLENTLSLLPERDADRVVALTNNTPTADNKDLFTEDVYHFYQGDFKGDTFDPSFSRGRVDKLGTHVGTKDAARDRAKVFLGNMDAVDPAGNPVIYDLPDGARGGATMPLRARVNRPFLNESGEVFEEGDIIPLMNRYADVHKIADLDVAMEEFRKDLTDSGFTHIPYKNNIEGRDLAGERTVSNIMLTNRTAGDPAVLKGRFAAFEDVYDPGLMKAKGGAVYDPDLIKKNAAELSLDFAVGGSVERDAYAKSKQVERDAYRAERDEKRRTGKRDFTGTDVARSVLGQGLMLGWGDEAEAWVRTKLGDETYEQAVKDIRQTNATYNEEHPYASLAGEIAGGFIPTVAALAATPFTGGASTVAAGGNLARLASIGSRRLGPLGTAGVVGATEGAIAGAGMAEEGGRLKGAGIGTVIGGTLGTGIQKGSEAALGALNRRAANKAVKVEAEDLDENKRNTLRMLALAPIGATLPTILPDVLKVAARKTALRVALPKLVTSADITMPELSKLVTKLYNQNRLNKVRPAADSSSALGEFTPINEEEFMRGNLAEILDFIEVEKLGTRKGSTGESADSARYYEGFSDPNLTDIAQDVEGISDIQKDAFDSVFGQGWNDGVEKINLTGVADGYDNEGLSLAVRKFREETDRPIAPDTARQNAIEQSVEMAEIQRARDIAHLERLTEIKNKIKDLSTEDIEISLNDTYQPYGGKVSYTRVDGEERMALVEELLKRKPVEQWNYNFPQANNVIKMTGGIGAVENIVIGPFKNMGPTRQLIPELDVEWMLKAKQDVKNRVNKGYDPEDYIGSSRYAPLKKQGYESFSGPPGSEMSEDEMRAFVKWAREKGVQQSPEYKAIQKRRRDAKKEAGDFDSGYAKGGAVYNPNLIKKNAVQLLMEADNG